MRFHLLFLSWQSIGPMASFHTKFALLIFNTRACPCQATITGRLIFLNVQVQCQTSLLLIIVFLFENMVKVQNFLHTFCWLIKSAVFCIFHFIPRMFCSFTQHCCFCLFSLSGLRSCWSECLGSACSTTFGRKTVWTNRPPITHTRVYIFLTRG